MTERKSAEERTAELLVAAERIMERGNRLTVTEITAEAGIASGTFYLYYPSKAHLEATLIQRFMADFVAAARGGMDARDGQGATEAVMAAMVEYAASHRAILRLLVTHAPTAATREEIGEGMRALKDLLVRALAVDDTGRHMVDPDMTAALLFHGLEGSLRDAVAFDRRVEQDRLIAALRRLVAAVVPARV